MSTQFIGAVNAMLGVLAPFVTAGTIPGIVHVFSAEEISSAPGTYLTSWETLLEHPSDNIQHHAQRVVSDQDIYVQMRRDQLSDPDKPLPSLIQLGEDIAKAFADWTLANRQSEGFTLAATRLRASFIQEVGSARLVVRIRTIDGPWGPS